MQLKCGNALLRLVHYFGYELKKSITDFQSLLAKVDNSMPAWKSDEAFLPLIIRAKGLSTRITSNAMS